MSLKKDVEKIASLLERNKTIETSVLWEAFFGIFCNGVRSYKGDVHDSAQQSGVTYCSSSTICVDDLLQGKTTKKK